MSIPYRGCDSPFHDFSVKEVPCEVNSGLMESPIVLKESTIVLQESPYGVKGIHYRTKGIHYRSCNPPFHDFSVRGEVSGTR